jgi:ribosome-binding protein aMBF1 (putative translation factor)
MLPARKSADFPKALKKAREDKGLSYSDLARMANIHAVMQVDMKTSNQNCLFLLVQKHGTN